MENIRDEVWKLYKIDVYEGKVCVMGWIALSQNPLCWSPKH